MTDPYNETVRTLFSELRHAGDLAPGCDTAVTASAGSNATGAKLVLAAAVVDGEIRELKFRSYGCPHLIAACEYFCRQYSGSAAASLSEFSQQQFMHDLGVPVEKTGRILLLEDAIGSLATQTQN